MKSCVVDGPSQGRRGEDKVIRVPVGTIVREIEVKHGGEDEEGEAALALEGVEDYDDDIEEGDDVMHMEEFEGLHGNDDVVAEGSDTIYMEEEAEEVQPYAYKDGGEIELLDDSEAEDLYKTYDEWIESYYEQLKLAKENRVFEVTDVADLSEHGMMHVAAVGGKPGLGNQISLGCVDCPCRCWDSASLFVVSCGF